MPKSSPDPFSLPGFEGRIVVVASRYNSKYTDSLVDSALDTLEKLCPKAQVEVIRVPGAFEIPVAAEKLARAIDHPPSAIVALGVIIRGSTAHADLIAGSITSSLHQISLAHCLPVIHEVLLVENEKQAEDRSLGDELNRGREAAEAAVEMIKVMQSIES